MVRLLLLFLLYVLFCFLLDIFLIFLLWFFNLWPNDGLFLVYLLLFLLLGLLLYFLQFVQFLLALILSYPLLGSRLVRLDPGHKKFADRGLVEPTLHPYPIHLKPGLPILEQPAMDTSFHLDQPGLGTHLLNLGLVEVVHADSIVLHVEVIPELAIALIGHVDLPEIVPAVVPEEEAGARLHEPGYFADYCLVLLGHDSRQHKYHGDQVGLGLERNLVLDHVAYFYTQALFVLGVLLHLLLYQLDRLGRDVAALVVEVRVLTKQGK